jgi:hypothetical protein
MLLRNICIYLSYCFQYILLFIDLCIFLFPYEDSELVRPTLYYHRRTYIVIYTNNRNPVLLYFTFTPALYSVFLQTFH